jgi:hypothetical protein
MSDREHWRRIREQLLHEKHVDWLEAKIQNLEELLHETVCELNRYRTQKAAASRDTPTEGQPP